MGLLKSNQENSHTPFKKGAYTCVVMSPFLRFLQEIVKTLGRDPSTEERDNKTKYFKSKEVEKLYLKRQKS